MDFHQAQMLVFWMILVAFAVSVLTVISLIVYKKWVESHWTRKGLYTYSQADKTAVATYNAIKGKGLKHGAYKCFFRSHYMPIDMDIIKEILIKKFDHFSNHDSYCSPKVDPLSACLPHLQDQEWKRIRAALSPVFSSGKLKLIIPILLIHTKHMLGVMDEYAQSNRPLETKVVSKRYGIDTMGSLSFGAEINTLENKNAEFYKLVDSILTMNWRKITEYTVNKQILKFFSFRRTDPQVEMYIRNIFEDAFEYRKKNKLHRDDIFQYVHNLTDDCATEKQLRNGKKLSPEEMMANLYILFFGGFETSSNVTSFALLELAMNPNIQSKLRENINEHLSENEEISYEALMKMNYLEWVLHETLRKYAPVSFTNRICRKTFMVPDSDVVIHPGETVAIPIYAVHMDPDIYPDPEKFIPERFTPKNRGKRHPMSFLAFGEGPRKCIGTRLGFIITKIAVASVIRTFKVTLNEKTITPIRYDTKKVLMEVEGGIWLNFSKA